MGEDTKTDGNYQTYVIGRFGSFRPFDSFCPVLKHTQTRTHTSVPENRTSAALFHFTVIIRATLLFIELPCKPTCNAHHLSLLPPPSVPFDDQVPPANFHRILQSNLASALLYNIDIISSFQYRLYAPFRIYIIESWG